MDKKILLHPKLKLVFLIVSVFIELSSGALPAMEDLDKELYKNESIKTVHEPTNDEVQNENPMNLGSSIKIFNAVVVDDENNKWFSTEAGIVSFDGKTWILLDKNTKVESKNIKGIAFEKNSHGQEIWLATPNGANVASLPIDAVSGATTYHNTNTSILSNNVLRISVGKSPLRWFGTDKGISAFKSDKWLVPDYEEFYPEFIFQNFPVLSMATDLDGDTLYVGTDGAGVARVFSNEVDGISGASVFAQWGPMILPSDKIYSILIAKDGAKWFGTDSGIARHIGQNSLENWTAFTTKEGLINDFVQAIAEDKEGKIWFGTKEGISVFNGSAWISYTEKDGLSSNNVLCIAVDNKGTVWIGTDNGVTSFENGTFIIYR